MVIFTSIVQTERDSLLRDSLICMAFPPWPINLISPLPIRVWLVPYNNKSLTFVMDSFGRQIRATGITWRLISQLNSNVPSTTSIIVFSFSLFPFVCVFVLGRRTVLRVILLALPSDSFGIPPPPLCNKVPPKRLGSSPSLQRGIIQTARERKGGGSLVFLVYKYM